MGRARRIPSRTAFHRTEAGEREHREERIVRCAEGAARVWLRAAQLEQWSHTDDGHYDRAEHQHRHNIGGERLAAELD